MNIELYVNTSQSNFLSKNISLIGTSRVIEPFGDFDILVPFVVLDYKDEWLSCNYAFIPQLSRYYYIDTMTLQTAKKVALRLRCDVLMSFKEEILLAVATIVRNEQIGSTNVIDNMLPIDPKEIWYEGIDFPIQPLTEISDESSANYVLVVRN